MATENDYVEFYTDSSGETRWRYRAGNNEVMADSAEGYQEASDALLAARRVLGKMLVFSEHTVEASNAVRAQWSSE